MTEPTSTGVVGAGLMGRDIAGLLANGGFPVSVVDVDPDALAAASDFHDSRLADALDAGGITVRGNPAARISYGSDLDLLSGCEFVVEAVPEDLALKRSLVADLESTVGPETVIATNTSSLTPGEIATDLTNPERVVLFHFANPALERDIVEIAGDEATQKALAMARDVAAAIDRQPVELGAEYRANCLSRLSATIKCAGTWELLEAEAGAIDRGARNLGFDRGPLEIIDLIGIDVHLATVDNLRDAYGDRYAPPTAIRERMEAMVADGNLGKKTGQGFFAWEDGTCLLPEVEDPRDVTPVVAALVNEAHRLVQDGVGDRETIDEVLRRGSGGDLGPFDAQAMLGQDFLRESLERRHAETGAAIYEPVF